jgi:transglutaminase-like putative cysteine protease
MTLEHMRRLAIAGSKDLAVRQAAIAALDRAHTPDHDPGAAVSAVYEFVRALRFVPDPVRTQAIQSPRATLMLRAGNCAQRATLLAAMLLSIGIPAQLTFRVIAANPRFPRQFSHVYVMATVPGQRISLDPTYSTNPLGFEYPLRSRVGDFDL